jgi:hypothetical protein
MRRNDLCGKGEKLASIDGLVFGHPVPCTWKAPPNPARVRPPQLRMPPSNRAQFLRSQARGGWALLKVGPATLVTR